jgi:hypothetical protein
LDKTLAKLRRRRGKTKGKGIFFIFSALKRIKAHEKNSERKD